MRPIDDKVERRILILFLFGSSEHDIGLGLLYKQYADFSYFGAVFDSSIKKISTQTKTA